MRGERIGDAFIRIHADGSGLDEDLKKQFEGRDEMWRAQGKREGEAYSAGREAAFQQRAQPDQDNVASLFRHLDTEIGRNKGQAQWAENWLQAFRSVEHEGKTFEQLFQDTFGKEVSDRFFTDLEKNLNRGKIQSIEQLFQQFGRLPGAGGISGMETLRAKISTILDEIVRDEEKSTRERLKIEDQWAREMVAANKHAEAEVEKIRSKQLDALKADIIERSRLETEALNKMIDDHDRRFETWTSNLHQNFLKEKKDTEVLSKAFNDLVKDIHDFRKGTSDADVTSKSLITRITALSDEAHRLGTEFRDSKGAVKDTEKVFHDLTSGVKTAGRNIHFLSGVFDSLIKKMDSKPRNDFFNALLIGFRGILTLGSKMVRGVESLLGGLLNRFKGMENSFEQVAAKAAAAGDGIAITLGEQVAESSISWQNLVANMAAFLVVGAAVASLSGIIAAALSGLAAILTSLVAVLGLGLVGAAGAALGALLPLGAAIGVVVLAVKSLGKKGLVADMKPVTSELKSMGKAAASHLFKNVSDWAKDLQPILHRLRPAILGVADAIGNTITNALEKANKSKGFKKFTDAFNVFLPNATRKLGRILTNVFGGLGGVFRSLIPLTNRFLNWLQDITGEFSKWSNSNKGQRDLKSFFKVAGDAAASLGNFLGQATKALGTLLVKAEPSGQTILDDLANAAADLTRWLQDPKNQKKINDWLQFGVDLAHSLGNAAKGIGRLFDALDTPATRKTLTRLLDAIGKIATAISRIPGLTVLAASIAGTIFQIGNLFHLFDRLTSKIHSVPSVKDIFAISVAGIQTLIGWFNTLGDKIKGVPVIGTMFGPAITAAQQLLDLVDRLINLIPHIPHIFGGGGGGSPFPPASGSHDANGSMSPFSSNTWNGSKGGTWNPPHGATGRTVVVPNINVSSPSADPKAVAQEVVNRLVAVGY